MPHRDLLPRRSVSVDGVLEPKLTKHDKRVIAALPAELPIEELCGPWEPPYGPPRQDRVTAWEIGQALRDPDVAGIERTLRGLEHLGYVRQYGYVSAGSRRPARWYRAWRGEEAIR